LVAGFGVGSAGRSSSVIAAVCWWPSTMFSVKRASEPSGQQSPPNQVAIVTSRAGAALRRDEMQRMALAGAYLCAKYAASAMRTWGRASIVPTATVDVLAGRPCLDAQTAAKGAASPMEPIKDGYGR
jgi:hypothetical protein